MRLFWNELDDFIYLGNNMFGKLCLHTFWEGMDYNWKVVDHMEKWPLIE